MAEKESINDQDIFDRLCVTYYTYAIKFCLNNADRNELKDRFKDVLDLDILDLANKLSPLGFDETVVDELN